MAEVGLQTDMEVSQYSQELVHEGIAYRRIERGRDEEVLDRLKQLHREEEKYSRSEGSVGGLGVDPPRREQPNSCKGSGHFHRETHL